MQIKYLPVGAYGTNCYFLCDEAAGVCAVIDPGGSPDQIRRALEGLACKPCAIFLTHGHYDHTGAVAGLLAQYPETPVYIHRLDYTGVDTQMFPLSAQVPPEAVTCYDEGDALPVGGLTVEVLHTPGHSEGSVTLRCGDALFCGDTLMQMIRPGSRRQRAKTINFKREARKINYEQKTRGYTRKCAVCGRTDTDYPDLEFRYCSRCVGVHCFCQDHINNHVHFTE